MCRCTVIVIHRDSARGYLSSGGDILRDSQVEKSTSTFSGNTDEGLSQIAVFATTASQEQLCNK
jgi:hypothetical protein